jgi:hypothetical protein
MSSSGGPRSARLFAFAALAWLGCGEPEPAREAPAPEVDAAEVERLRALGYVDVRETAPDAAPPGVSRRDAARSQPGLNFFTSAHLCRADLMDAAGEIERSWSLAPCQRWEHAVLLPSGDVLALHRGPDEGAAEGPRELVRLDWEGRVLWRRRLAVHHDVTLRPDGQIAVLTFAHRSAPELDSRRAVRDSSISVVTPDGRLVEEVSLLDVMRSAPNRFRLAPGVRRTREQREELDPLHTNSLEWIAKPWLAERDPLYAEGHVLVCHRHQDTIAIFDWAQRRLLWTWGAGELSGPHDATLLDDGRVLVFDNGLGRGWSRVLEVDPLEDRIVWEYRAPRPRDFYTAARGAAQRLANGNTLVTESGSARAFEITPQGEIVWEYRSPHGREQGREVAIVRMRRVLPSQQPGERFAVSD